MVGEAQRVVAGIVEVRAGNRKALARGVSMEKPFMLADSGGLDWGPVVVSLMRLMADNFLGCRTGVPRVGKQNAATVVQIAWLIYLA